VYRVNGLEKQYIIIRKHIVCGEEERDILCREDVVFILKNVSEMNVTHCIKSVSGQVKKLIQNSNKESNVNGDDLVNGDKDSSVAKERKYVKTMFVN